MRIVSELLRARLHQSSESMLPHFLNDARDTIPIENNGVAPEWNCNPVSRDSIVFTDNKIHNVIAELLQRCSWCLV